MPAIISLMNATSVVHDFALVAERDAVLFRIGELVYARVQWWLWTLVRPLLLLVAFPIFLVFAQIAPFIFRKHLNVITPHMANITDRAALSWLKDAFTLYFVAMKEYRRFCIFRERADALLDDLDEEIDSLKLVLDQGIMLDQVVKQIQNQ